MLRLRRLAPPVALVVALVALAPLVTQPASAVGAAPTVHHACDTPAEGYASCFAEVVTPGAGATPSTAPAGYGPADLQAAYQLPALPASGATFVPNGRTIAIVDAYDNPKAAADLLAYRTQFGLPLCSGGGIACLFTKVTQAGLAAPLPAGNLSWGIEIALDIEIASAGCPMCNILLVEARTNSWQNLGIAVNRAATMGADVISNSYGGAEPSNTSVLDNTYYSNHAGIPVLASSGDRAYSAGAQFPATGAKVIAVGGTSLRRSATAARGWTERAWAGAGSGCSAVIAKPAWQKDTLCTMKMASDISAVADTATPVAVYDLYTSPSFPWVLVGGTSVSAPFVASLYALAGNAATAWSPGYLYNHKNGNVFDVRAGSNGACGGTYLCTAVVGYDGPTGLGSPKGLGAL